MLEQSPSQTVGPFFHFGLFRGGENILVNDTTQGQRVRIIGHVFDGDGAVILDAMLEIWQADAQGYFNHPADPHQALADKQFRGFGRADTANDGIFSFETIKPGGVTGYDGNPQAPQINVRIFSRGLLTHADTRLYFADEPANQSDAFLNSIDPARRHTLMAVLVDSGPVPTYRFDIHLQGDDETVFFA